MKAELTVPSNVTALDGRLDISISCKDSEGVSWFYADGDMEFQDPPFEPQLRLDPREGFSFNIKMERPESILAIYQHKSWWTSPAFPGSFEDIPDRTQMLMLKYPGNTVCLTAAVGDVFRTDFYGDKDCIGVRVSSNRVGDCNVHTALFTSASDFDPYEAVRKTALANGKEHMMLPREERKYPEIFEGFGWCTWNAFYKDVSEDGIIQKLEEFKEKRVPVSWVLIDDGWLSCDADRLTLTRFEADSVKFPNGLAGTVKLIKEKYGVRYVGVWHATFGYWCGLTPGSEAETLLGGYCSYLPDGRIVISPDEEKAFAFYDTFHSWLREQGIDFVKVDNQSAISVFYEGIASYGASAEILKGLERSAERNFGGSLINCMGMAPQEVWSRRRSMLTRTSDDFFPDIQGSFASHVMQNAYSSLWTGSFYTGDWDMFFTQYPEAKNNAVLRAVSGGPVYVSDKVGKTYPGFILPLLNEDGTIKRCDGPGLPAPGVLFKDPRKCGLMKIINRRGNEIYVAVFDINRTAEVSRGTITMADLAFVMPHLEAEPYKVKGLFSNTYGTVGFDEPFIFALGNSESELFIITQ
ncbi:MAG: alpha-galactosidase [Blautia sp.]|nr:alpha-galactosidase [Blautia sp.]